MFFKKFVLRRRRQESFLGSGIGEERKAKQKMKKAASDEIKISSSYIYYFANNNKTEIKIVFISFSFSCFFGRGKSVNKDWINKRDFFVFPRKQCLLIPFSVGIIGGMFAFARGVRGWASWSHALPLNAPHSTGKLPQKHRKTLHRPCTPGIPTDIPLVLQRPAKKKNSYARWPRTIVLIPMFGAFNQKKRREKRGNFLSCKRVKREQVRRNVAEKREQLVKQY